MKVDLLPDCMLPDGAEPCKAYSELYKKALILEQALIRITKDCTARKSVMIARNALKETSSL